MTKTLKELEKLAREIMGPKMTKEQLEFRNILRQKVKNKELKLSEAHRLWEKKYKVAGISEQLAEEDYNK